MDSNSSSITRYMGLAQNAMNKSQERLASGWRINRAVDDAAGLAVAAALDATAATLSVATNNASYGQSMASIADSAMGEIGGIMARMGELAEQASNGVYSDEQRASMKSEYDQLAQEAQRITETTTFNGVQVLAGQGFTIQTGTDGSVNSQITVAGPDLGSVVSSLAAVDISTQAGAQSGLDTINSQIQNLASARGSLGASMARLDEAISNNSATREAVIGASARIRDADVADEVANYTANNIKTQGSAAMLAQANVSQQMVLRLLG